MARFGKITFIAAAISAAALFALPTKARANIELDIWEDGGTHIVMNSANDKGPVSFSGDVNTTGAVVSGDFTITISVGKSNSPGGLTGLTQLANTFITANYLNGASDVFHTLHIEVSAQDFTTPNSPPPVTVLDTTSGSQVNGKVSGDARGFADATNALFGTSFPAPDLTFSVAGLSQSWSANGDSHGGFLPAGGTYSLTILQNLTLNGGANLTLAGANVQTAPTPAPSTAVLALTALPLLGLGLWVRRRMTRKAPVAA